MSIWTDPFYPYSYWADLAENQPDFLIDGMLHAATNSVSGKPTVGKTRLVAAMAAAIANEEPEFCGSAITDHGPVMVIATDAGETRRWGLRMREHGVSDGRVGIAKFDQQDWKLYEDQARTCRLLVLDNLTGILGGGSIADDVVARRFCTPLSEIAENGITVLLIAAWERLNLRIHDVAEPSTRSITIRSNDHGNRKLLLQAEWGRASAGWSPVEEGVDTRQRSEEAHLKRNELFERIVSDPELSQIESERELGRRLFAADPDKFESEDAARMVVRRAKKSAGGVFLDGHWQLATLYRYPPFHASHREMAKP